MGIPEKLAELEALDSESAIASYARRLGIKAFPCAARGCAVAKILDPSGKLDVLVKPDAQEVRWWENDSYHAAILPASVVRFAKAFDNGSYPDLEVDDL